MLKIDDLIIDKEFEELLPVLTPEEFVRLEQSILKDGMLDPIKVWFLVDTKNVVNGSLTILQSPSFLVRAAATVSNA